MIDNELFSIIDLEKKRQQRCIDLIASENIVSDSVLKALGSVLTNKYAEGYPGQRYYGGCSFVDKIEQLCIARVKDLFGAEYANVQPHSGSQANMAVYNAVLSIGDTVLGMNLNSGGHLTHGCKVNFSGKYYNFLSYGLNEYGYIDYDEVEKLAKECNPKLIVCGASAYSRKIDFERFKHIADQVGSFLMADISHISGLIATGFHQSPVPYADFITSTTHKTLRGPRGGFILCKEKYGSIVDKSVFPGIQGGPHMHTIAAKAVCFKDAMSSKFKDYISNVISNCQSIADELLSLGMSLVSGGSDNHLLIVDLSKSNITGNDFQNMLEKVNIIVNKETVPGDQRSPRETSGIRIGTASMSSRGFSNNDCKTVANLIFLAYKDFRKYENFIKSEVERLVSKYPIYNGGL